MATQISTAASLYLVLSVFLFAFTAVSDTPPSPSPSNDKCPIDALKLSVCTNVINGLINIMLGKSQTDPCCMLLRNLISHDAIACLCTALKANILGINLLPTDLSLPLNYCGKEVAIGFQCP